MWNPQDTVISFFIIIIVFKFSSDFITSFTMFQRMRGSSTFVL